MRAVRGHAMPHGLTLWDAAGQSGEFLNARAAGALKGFLALIDSLAGDIEHLELGEQVSRVVRGSGLIERLTASGSETDRMRGGQP